MCNQVSKPHTSKKSVSSNSKAAGISSPAEASQPVSKSHKAKSSASACAAHQRWSGQCRKLSDSGGRAGSTTEGDKNKSRSPLHEF